MPELPEVEHVKKGITPFAEGQTIIDIYYSVQVFQGKKEGRQTIIKGNTLEDFSKYAISYTIEKIERRSKYILFHLRKDSNKRIIVGHLGMAGGFFIVNNIEDIPVENYRKHWHVAFKLDNDMLLVFSDIRRFGELRNIGTYDGYPSLKEIAPEPFDDSAYAHFMHKLNQKSVQSKPIKQVILDHRVISGCGNIYACEALFNAKLHPATKVKQLSDDDKTCVFQEIVDVLKLGIKYGGTSVTNYRHADGNEGTMQDRLQVYKKHTCPVCRTPIRREIIGKRNTHYCPNCQN
ncbi:bifunctional DNA-formamidopyrimidine glycosylase/DNA-(apurinic or apyrimidinic site) lyase [Staphylococcus massiliensis]|uniref:Formamidopyrimidine-DNA glycosylase n=1 Tax=Staphylococcus massiliensis S46 TaxID=1229783 RepID=K9AVQ9_9STAP|nr:bifunctional DNA-formamidopyrimidine glycosylase/DNA-(apurinic or apyrimidinic site) lyase [Staphylococcus massiliensis]EKU50196.1 formamidopyrimidine-DNA glycosylase [Staphylococcus massiliensis S46]MCG3400880.1 bifunctional DNA-formamidopyrimidine glycosylase/DNA-(apurinic or apyrimidinic site) lyase [Staphylococcus massiliensis]POA01679.1 bifunctional DNA-formamidopyrimidine glycosylase/DNA-(apurinic or apyrimidinic site) lyase [Staphylococcus massiliensis CCUG 55927]